MLGVVGWWAAPPLVALVSGYAGRSLGDKDSIASVVSMVVGLLSLLVAVLFGTLQLRQGGQPSALSSADRREQQAAERLGAHLGRSDRLWRIGDRRTSALALRVHPALDPPTPPTPVEPDVSWWRRLVGRAAVGPDPALPTFVPRDRENDVRQWLRGARDTGGFLILVGNSCVGKTRLLYETARAELPDFTVLAPDLGDGGLVDAIAGATFPLPKLIVWLDELQRFLPGPYLTADASPITVATVRRLLDAPTPVIILGTLWPPYAETLRADITDSPDQPRPGQRRPRYPEAVDILDDRRVRQLRLDTFSRGEREAAARLAGDDQRLAVAVADRDYNVTEALAGARQIIDRYERATDEQRAILHAAVDARRVGVQSPLTADLLRAAARGHLTMVRADDGWFPGALAELTSRTRPQDRATAPLGEVASDDHRAVLGYTITDYLHQRLIRQRRAERIPTLTWQALVAHASGEDLTRLADSAMRRLRYGHAVAAYRRLADAGHRNAADELTDLLAEPDHVERLRADADAGSREAARRLAYLLARRGETEQLRTRADSGDGPAAAMLVELLVAEGDIEQAARRADAGDVMAKVQLADLWSARGDGERLRAWADAGDVLASVYLVSLLVSKGDEAGLRARADAGDFNAAHTLTEILVDRREVAELAARAYAGDVYALITLEKLPQAVVDAGGHGADDEARSELTDSLTGQADLAALQAHADAGDRTAETRLVDLLIRRGEAGQLRTRAEAGSWPAQRWLARVLSWHGDVDGLRVSADAGNVYAAHRLVDLLAEQNRGDELFAEVLAGTSGAARHWLGLLVRQGRRERAARIRRHGLDDTDS
ncbi:hypothetical protein O7606_01295 [Micromonospora sp. WMMD882]|uniref:hypothetical protein n=1 Tax=Micromonospora sp. WMMD882 TaxID=3015151 RepID=UPI00248B4673|nr:hypothetical protein [Micromonospora sp. WMMD882]WBB80063.1 hypothetical protein O7606_01295 [Micromonospora sp. WMMD882]